MSFPLTTRARILDRLWRPLILYLAASLGLQAASCGTGSTTTSATDGGGGPSPIAVDYPRWEGDCPYERGENVVHLVLAEESPSERTDKILADRLTRIHHQAQQAADCNAQLVVYGLTRGRPEPLFSRRLGSNLGNEKARDAQVDRIANDAMAAIAR